jgi:hypothetical protein
VWIENTGQGKFTIHELPGRAQFSSVNDIAPVEYNGNAFVVAGNLYGSEVETPRNDASVGLVIKYDKGSGMQAVPPSESGLIVKGEVRGIVPIKLASGKSALLFGINRDSLKLIEMEHTRP